MKQYKDLKTENENMRHPKITTERLIVGALGMTKKVTKKHINKITSSPSQHENKKNALCRTVHLLRRVPSK